MSVDTNISFALLSKRKFKVNTAEIGMLFCPIVQYIKQWVASEPVFMRRDEKPLFMTLASEAVACLCVMVIWSSCTWLRETDRLHRTEVAEIRKLYQK
jgi:hypothetical protein